MIITKTKEILLKKDVYILETLGNLLIINDDYEGLLILNTNLNTITHISFKNSICIYSLFKSFDYTKILLYCPDERIPLVIVHLTEKMITPLTFGDQQVRFSPIYWWDNNALILTDYEYNCYVYDDKSQSLNHIENNLIKTKFSKFYSFWQEAIKYPLTYQIDCLNLSFIAVNEKVCTSTFINFFNNTKNTIKIPSELEYHDIVYHNGVFCCISEEKILITTKNNNYPIFPSVSYRFLRARFIFENNVFFLAILSSNEDNPQESKLELYQIEEI